MNARELQDDDFGTDLEVVTPVLFNTWKHHAGALRSRILSIAQRGQEGLTEIGSRLAVVGTRLMDLYTGTLSPRELSTWIIDEVRRAGYLELEPFRIFLLSSEEYSVFTHPGDGSRWVLRLGDEHGRYIHLHPGRWSPHSARVRANVLKTAFLTLVHTRIHGGNSLDRQIINEVRRVYLGLSPLGHDLETEQGLGAVIALLRDGPEPGSQLSSSSRS